MRDPCWVVGINRPGHASEPAQVPRVTYRNDSYGFGSRTHCRSLLAETEAGKRWDATRITTAQLLPMSEIRPPHPANFFPCNIVFIFIQVSLVNDKPK